MKKMIALTLAGCMVLTITAGCGKDSRGEAKISSIASEGETRVSADGDGKQATEASRETDGQPDSSEASVPGTEITDPEVRATVTPATNTADYLSLPNDSIPFGYSKTDRDPSNVPNGVYYYRSLYGAYGADFIQDTSQNIIYLTMDEGYEAGYTPSILDTLSSKGVHAVFFVTKQFVDEHPELVQRMIDEGHVIGNHTCAHPSGGMPQLGADAEIADITKLHDMVLDQFGYDMKLFRFPEGTFSQQSLALVHSLGYQSVFWSFAHADWNTDNQPDPAASLNTVLEEIHPGAIYLLHAVSATNTQILGDFIDGARARGYEFGVYPVK